MKINLSIKLSEFFLLDGLACLFFCQHPIKIECPKLSESVFEKGYNLWYNVKQLNKQN